MLKLVEFPGQVGDEIFVQSIGVGGGLEKTASNKATLHPEIAERMSKIAEEKDPNKLYVLVNALGAGEYYGANANGDYFEEKYLDKKAADWGHATFTDPRSGVYRHHRNKDVNKSMGKVDTAVWNPRMKRVELIVCILRDRARALGHESLITALDNDEHPSVSMGCKVKYDVCSICAHKSKTRSDYCTHARSMMNRILPDGRKVFVYNPFPRFFDISFVVIGADKISYAMAKVASVSPELSAELAKMAGLRDPDLDVSKSAELKTSQIEKHVVGVAEKIVPDIESRGKSLDRDTIKGLAKEPLPNALAATTAAGIVLRPEEYQDLVLHRAGKSKMADDLASRGIVFGPTHKVDRTLPIGNSVSEKTAALVASYMSERSCFLPFVPGRVLLEPTRKCKLSHDVQNDEPILETISAGYNGYRIEVLEKLGGILNEVTTRSPSIMKEVAAANLEVRLADLEKDAMIGASAMPLLGVVPLAYLYRAYVKERKGAGEKISVVDSFIEKHPVFSASMAMGLARLGMALKESGHVDQGINTLLQKVL